MVVKALKWLAVEYLKAFVFCASIALCLGFLMTLIAFPVQTIVALVIGLIVLVAYTFVYDSY